jgi:hypothetical protein
MYDESCQFWVGLWPFGNVYSIKETQKRLCCNSKRRSFVGMPVIGKPQTVSLVEYYRVRARYLEYQVRQVRF